MNRHQAPSSAHETPIPRAPSHHDDVFSQFLTEHEDITGLAAYGLHRRAFEDFLRAFTSKTGAKPDDHAIAQFMIGETMPSRIDAYRAEAARLIALKGRMMEAGASPSPSANHRTFRGMTGFKGEVQKPLSWRILALRLMILLGAVIFTALALRILIVSP